MGENTQKQKFPIVPYTSLIITTVAITTGVCTWFFNQKEVLVKQLELISKERMEGLEEKLEYKDSHIKDLDATITNYNQKETTLTTKIDGLEERISLKNKEIDKLRAREQELMAELIEIKEKKVIHVIHAKYGRYQPIDVTGWFSNECNGKQECEKFIRPQDVFGDPEYGIEKGIIVKYSCGTSSAKIFELKPLMEPATVKVRLQCY
ncbi:MAG: hypothetical protein GY702_26910 [Desulfobulbaceae bacterium]|nr:hypothetical protein [Desulfobulbaceae bacterium]